jgi:hypothetical protein
VAAGRRFYAAPRSPLSVLRPFAMLAVPRRRTVMALSLLPLLLAFAAQDAQEAPVREDVPIPEKVQPPPESDEPPTVSIRTGENGDVIEEYRINGQLYMVKVTPQRGKPYYLYDTDGNGKLNRDEGGPRVSPVYWTIYEWD